MLLLFSSVRVLSHVKNSKNDRKEYFVTRCFYYIDINDILRYRFSFEDDMGFTFISYFLEGYFDNCFHIYVLNQNYRKHIHFVIEDPCGLRSFLTLDIIT